MSTLKMENCVICCRNPKIENSNLCKGCNGVMEHSKEEAKKRGMTMGEYLTWSASLYR